MFASLKQQGVAPAEIVKEIQAVQVAIAEAEKKLAATESEAHGEIMDAGAGGERRARELSGTLEAQKLRITALRTGLSRLKVALRAAVEREHDAARTRAETELTECKKEDTKIATELVPLAVKMFALIAQRHGHKKSPVAAVELFSAVTGIPYPVNRAGWDELNAAAAQGDATAKALVEAVASVETLPPGCAERRENALRILNPFPPVDVDAQVIALLKRGAPLAAE